MKTYIVSQHFNRTDYIRLQYETLAKYFVTEYEYIVFNDAKLFGDYTNFIIPIGNDTRMLYRVGEMYDIQTLHDNEFVFYQTHKSPIKQPKYEIVTNSVYDYVHVKPVGG